MKGQSGPTSHLSDGEDSATKLQSIIARFWLRAVMLCAGMVALADWIGCTFWVGRNSCGILAYKMASEDAKAVNRSTSDAFLTEPWSMVCTFFIPDILTKHFSLIRRTTTRYLVADASQDQAEQRTGIHALL